MTPEDRKRIVRRYYEEIFPNRDAAARDAGLDELFAPDFVGHAAGVGDFTLTTIRNSIAQEHEHMPDDETIVEEQIAEGDRVLTRWRYRWKHDTSVFGETPTGQWLTMEGVDLDRLVDGKIVERWQIKDFWGVVRQLGGTVQFPTPQNAEDAASPDA